MVIFLKYEYIKTYLTNEKGVYVMGEKKSVSVPKKMREKYDEITRIIEEFCREYLNEEYEEKCCEMCAALSRKRPSPLNSGNSNSWACGIVHAIGMINFLFDPSEGCHIKAGDLYKAFGISNSTGLKYSKKVRDIMKVKYFDPDWSLSRILDKDPFTWIINIDGIALDIREAPYEIQQLMYEEGMIPYIPDDKIEEFDVSSVQFKQENLNSKEKAKRLNKAQNLMYEAWEAASKKERIKLAKKALNISPLCSDAYLLLASETTKSLEKSRDIIEMAVRAAEEAIGRNDFEEYRGMFWMVTETRPYMRARFELADVFWNLGEKRQAIDHLKDMLILNPNDNQGVRYILINWLIDAGNDIEIGALLKEYGDEPSANMQYSTALYFFKKELIDKANLTIKEAIKENPHVPSFLLGKKEMPGYLPPYYGIGDESEAISYVWIAFEVWHSTKGAIEWLHEKSSIVENSFNIPNITQATSNKIGRNEPCLCGSGEKYKKCCGK